MAIADGVVTRKGWDSGGGGNTLRLRHANNLESAYLHLKGYAKGISVGTSILLARYLGAREEDIPTLAKNMGIKDKTWGFVRLSEEDVRAIYTIAAKAEL